MTITTQDGRTLDLDEQVAAEFKAWQYAGLNRVIGKLTVRIRPKAKKHTRIEITLGEYNTYLEAEKEMEQLTAAWVLGQREYVVAGYSGAVLEQDDLMSSLKGVATLFSGCDYVVEFGMVHGKTNCRYDLNPDSQGSYAVALTSLKTKHLAFHEQRATA